MHRRTLLHLPLLACLAQAKTSGFKLSVRVEPLFPNLALPRQIEKVAEAGYQGFAFGNWRAADAIHVDAGRSPRDGRRLVRGRMP